MEIKEIQQELVQFRLLKFQSKINNIEKIET